jgi:hypothetical protein
MKIPFPGSSDAVARGCLCPILDNACGAGVLGDNKKYWISFDCPLHNPEIQCKDRFDRSASIDIDQKY